MSVSRTVSDMFSVK